MHFSDDDLRAALKRKEPGEGFTQRVMAQVEQAKAEGNRRPVKKSRWALPVWWTQRPAWALAVVAVLLLGFAWAGYQYSEYRHELLAKQEHQRLEDLKRQQEEAERARDQAILALKIARSKLNHVLEQAQVPVEIDRTRRQRL
jgi:hypothetical protein